VSYILCDVAFYLIKETGLSFVDSFIYFS